MTSRRNILSALAASTGALITGEATLASAKNILNQGIYKAYEIGAQTGPESLRIVERPVKMPRSSEVLIKVKAASINARDHGLIANRFPVPPGRRPSTRVPLSEGAGVVIACGNHVDNVKVGDRVTSAHFSSWIQGPWDPEQAYTSAIGNNIDGWLTELTTLPAKSLVKLPDNISEETAATFVSSGVTAWHALYETARIKPGNIVLSLGTGGVSSFGIQLAKHSGATTIVTSSSDTKLQAMKQNGADIGINYKTNPDWGQQVMAVTNGYGADIILENVGRKTLDQSLLSAATNSYVVMIGTGRLPEQLPKMPGLFMKNITMKAISNASAEMLAKMVKAYSASNLEPLIAGKFDFLDAAKAFQIQKQHIEVGKVIIEIN